MISTQKKSNNTFTACLTVLASVVLASCSGGDNVNGPQALGAASGLFVDLPSDTVTQIGTVYLDIVDGEGFAEAGFPTGFSDGFAEFTDYGQTLNEAFLRSEFAVGNADTCRIRIESWSGTQDVGIEKDAAILEIESNATSISAGSALTIMTSTGSWPDLIVNEEYWVSYEFQTYGAELGELPQGTTLTIPGDEFPAFDNLSIPVVERLSNGTVLNTVDGRVMPDSSVTWAAATGSTQGRLTTLIWNDLISEPATNDELEINLFCVVTDDGEFTFPENARQLLSKYEMQSEDVRLNRIAIATDVRGDAAVVLVNASTFFFQ